MSKHAKCLPTLVHYAIQSLQAASPESRDKGWQPLRPPTRGVLRQYESTRNLAGPKEVRLLPQKS